MKKTCNKCLALNRSMQFPASCKLGYKIDARNLKPLEPCPKPLTSAQYIGAVPRSGGVQ